MNSSLRNILLLALVTLLGFSSCGKGRKKAPEAVAEKAIETDHQAATTEYVPFKSSEQSRKWGLIGLDGTVLLADTLSAEPSNVVGGLFVMSDGKGYKAYYTAEAEPKQVGGEYTKAGLFYDEVAPCIEKGKSFIQFIRKDGTVAFEFKEVDGNRVEWVSRFYNGLAAFKAGKYVGYVDTKGTVVVPPQFMEGGRFSDGYALVVDTVGDNETNYRNHKDYRISIIDTAGRMMEHSFSSADSIGSYFSEGLVSMGEAPQDTLPRVYKFVDPYGTTIIPERDDYRQLSAMCGTHFAFNNGRFWGIADNQASVILTPLYDEVVFIGPASVVVSLYGKYKFLDYGGNQPSKSFDEVISVEDGQHFIGRRGGKWYVVDETGEAWSDACHKIVFNPGEEILKR